jgi:hypothetical protein
MVGERERGGVGGGRESKEKKEEKKNKKKNTKKKAGGVGASQDFCEAIKRGLVLTRWVDWGGRICKCTVIHGKWK